MFQKSPEKDKSSIGNVAVTLGYVTREQLQQALIAQQRSEEFVCVRVQECDRERCPLGQVLILLGFINLSELDEIMNEQAAMRGKKVEATRRAARKTRNNLEEIKAAVTKMKMAFK